MVLLQWWLVGLTGLVLLPILVLWIETLAAVVLTPTSSSIPLKTATASRRAILIPAHNEALVIARTLQQLLSQLRPDDQLIVIADNCTDTTAQIVVALGATVLEREDSVNRGKGYALDFGIQYLASHPSEVPPEVVVVVDADCWVESGSLDKLCDRALQTQRPTQAVYLFKPSDEQPTARQVVSLLAIRVKNWVRPLGLHHLRQPCLLTGTGMAFPWAALQSVPLASGNIVEDMQLGLDLTQTGYPPLLCPEAHVFGEQPQTTHAETTQRTRWEHGHLRTLAKVPALLWDGLRQRQLGLVALALDLAVPPLALLALLWVSTAALATVALFVSGIWLPALISYIAGVLFTLAILLAWGRFARDIALTKLLAVPLYLFWKVPLYFKFLTRPQLQWIRTERK